MITNVETYTATPQDADRHRKKKMKIIDLFCGAGGASMGYYRAGFEVVGVDIIDQPNYPFEFIKHDAVTFDCDEFDMIHASPPCQFYHQCSQKNKNHVDLIDIVREKIINTEKPYVIENITTAPLKKYFMLCGTMFGLYVKRHRNFECSHLILTPECRHGKYKKIFRTLDFKRHKKGAKSKFVGVHGSINYKGDFTLRKWAMGIDWMTNAELVNALPPAYTEYIGKKFIGILS